MLKTSIKLVAKEINQDLDRHKQRKRK